MRGTFCILACWLGSTQSLHTGVLDSTTFEHIVVFPDTHGDVYSAMLSIWKAYVQIENPDMVWEEFQTAMYSTELEHFLPRTARVLVVQLGDLVDRGPDSQGCVWLFSRIPAVIGWKTLSLYGNHELGTMLGSMDGEVHPADFNEFGGARSRRAAFSPKGDIYEYMVSNFLGMLKLTSPIPYTDPSSASTLFVHAGIDLEWYKAFNIQKFGIDRFNRVVEEVLTSADDHTRVAGMLSLDDQRSPFWTRTFETMSELNLCGAYLEEILHLFEVARIVVGHNPQSDSKVRSRCNGRILITDVRMSRWMSKQVGPPGFSEGHPMALIMSLATDGRVSSIEAHYTDLEFQMLDSVQRLGGDVDTVRGGGPLVSTLRRSAKSTRDLLGGSSMFSLNAFAAHSASQVSVSTLGRPSRSDPNPRQYKLMTRDAFSSIYFAEWNEWRGVMQVFEEWPNFAQIRDLQKVLNLPFGIPTILKEGRHPRTGKLYLFMDCWAKMSLHQRFLAKGELQRAEVDELRRVVSFVHEVGLVLGLADKVGGAPPGVAPLKIFLSMFGFNADPMLETIQLVDFALLKLATREETAREAELVGWLIDDQTTGQAEEEEPEEPLKHSSSLDLEGFSDSFDLDIKNTILGIIEDDFSENDNEQMSN